jgi:hypothetical protein
VQSLDGNRHEEGVSTPLSKLEKSPYAGAPDVIDIGEILGVRGVSLEKGLLF